MFSDETSDRQGLLTQTQARREAARLCAKGRVAIATTYPYSCWGGQENGWTVLEYPDLATMRRDMGMSA